MIMQKEELESYLQANGVVPFRIPRLVDEFLNDWEFNFDTTEEQKRWALERGFVSDKIELFRMTDENWTSFISDIDFYNAESYKNYRHTRWFDDKLTTWYMLNPFLEYMPVHYCYIDHGNIMPLDQRDSIEVIDSMSSLKKLLCEKGKLAFKECFGGHGAGFYEIEKAKDGIIVNRELQSEEAFDEYLLGLDNIIVTEFAQTEEGLLTLTNGATCVGRAALVYVDGKPEITAAIIRFATHSEDVIVDFEGTMYCGVTLETGELFDPSLRCDVHDVFRVKPCESHPTTGITMSGVISGWSEIVAGLKSIAMYLKPAPYLVIDFVPSDNGFKVLEINSHGQQRNMQRFYAFFDDENNRKLFKTAYDRTLDRARNLERK